MKTLKYIFIPLIILLVFGCDIDGLWGGGSSSNSNKTHFSPPNWIQGVWADEAINYHGFKFTKNDFIVHYDYTYDYGISYNSRINLISHSLSATEQISSSEYHITILHLSTNTTDYNFTKVSDNEINCHYKEIRWGEETIEDYSLTRR